MSIHGTTYCQSSVCLYASRIRSTKCPISTDSQLPISSCYIEYISLTILHRLRLCRIKYYTRSHVEIWTQRIWRNFKRIPIASTSAKNVKVSWSRWFSVYDTIKSNSCSSIVNKLQCVKIWQISAKSYSKVLWKYLWPKALSGSNTHATSFQ